MQNRQPLKIQYLHILQQISKEIDRQSFCTLHNISQSKLSRILTGKIQPDFDLLDYMAMHCSKSLNIYLQKV